VEKVIKLNADGSGTIEETVLMSKATIQQIEAMTKQMQDSVSKGGGAPEASKPFDLLDEKKLKQEAEQMGEGTAYVSATKLDTADSSGYKAIFSFKDINKLKIDQNPSGSTPSMGGDAPQPSNDKKELLAFHFTPGHPGELKVTMPAPNFLPKPPEAQKDDSAEDDAKLAQIQQMLKDMKVLVAIEPQGSIVKTNATYHEGSRVTLMEMDFNKLIADPAHLKQFAKANPQSLEEAKKIIKDIPGIKVETNREITVQFQ
jgi:hypothetical protein